MGWARWVAGCSVVVAVALMFSGIRATSATCDEVAHLPAGYTYLVSGDFRLNPEHPPLAKMLAAIPLVLGGTARISDSGNPWRLAVTQPSQEWQFGHDFLYATPGNDADGLLLHARMAMMLLPLLLALLLWLWAREIWGEVVAAAAVVLLCIEPNLLAHGPLVTTDVALTTFALGACYMLWRSGRALSIGNVLGLVTFVALSMLSTYSAVFLAPVLLAVLGIRAMVRSPWQVRFREKAIDLVSRARRLVAAITVLLLVGIFTWLATWAAFGFRYSAARAGSGDFPLSVALTTLKAQAHQSGGWQAYVAAPTLAMAANHKLLPEAVVYGVASMLSDAQGRPGYLMGNLYANGRWYYFLVAILVKTPLPILILAAIGAVGLLQRLARRDPGAWDQALVFVAPLIFLVIAMASSLNLGVRHVLPVYPYILLLAGSIAGGVVARRKTGSIIVLGLMGLWLLFGVARVSPHFLAYFNEVAGGPENGARWLVDSNLDWGQDLPGLARWLRKHGVGRVNLCYFGNADPTHYGINFVGLPGSWGVWDDRLPARPETPGYLAISASNLVGFGLRTADLRAYYNHLLEKATLVDTVGYSIYIYSLPGR